MRQDEPDTRPDPAGGSGEQRPGRVPVADALAQRVREIALDALAPSQRKTSNLYMDPLVVPQGSVVGPSFERSRPDRDCVLCFADHAPRANFAHPCSYYMHDVRTGEIWRRVAARFPPYPLEGLHFLDLFHEPVKPVEVVRKRSPRGGSFETRMRRALRAGGPAGRRYAILIAGMVEHRHLNDFELYLRTLTNNFGFARNDIFVLFHNGTDHGAPYLNRAGKKRTWPGSTDPADNAFTLVPDGKGSREAFVAAINCLKTRIKADDLLFVHTEGHGGVDFAPEGGQYLCVVPDGANSKERYYDFEMQADLKTLPSYKSLLVVMNHCFSGGFGDSLLAASNADRTFFAAACGADGLAWATTDLKWNEFSRNWIEAELHPNVPGTDDNNDGRIVAAEAYDYCVDENVAAQGSDAPVHARLPAPDAQGKSDGDEITMV